MGLQPSKSCGKERTPFLHDLYPGLTSFTSLLAAAQAAQRGKRWRPDVLAFNSRLEAELFKLQSELRNFTYQPGPYRRFVIRDPKPRLIAAAPYRDRVVHHALCAAIAPPLERRFLRTTFANRAGYGTHRALRRFIQASRDHRWVLTADIRLYFPSIDHQILMAQLGQVIACPGTLWLLASILANLNDNVGFRVCFLPPAPFTARAVGWEASGSARGVQTRSRDPALGLGSAQRQRGEARAKGSGQPLFYRRP
jgi:hypothetical protein